MKNATTVERFVDAFARMGAASFSFGEAVRLACTEDKLSPAQTALAAARAAGVYYDRSVQPAVAARQDADTLPSALTGIPQHKVAVDAISQGSDILKAATGYRLDGNAHRIYLPDVVAGKNKIYKAVKAVKADRAKNEAKAKAKATTKAPLVQGQLPTETKAGMLEAMDWREHLNSALQGAHKAGAMAELTAIVQKAWLENGQAELPAADEQVA